MNIIYALTDPVTGSIRYVGKTQNAIHQRLLGHINDASNRARRVRRFVWIRELRERGLVPQIVVLEEVAADWQQAERKWIARLKAQGCDLLNGTDGGEGIIGYAHSENAKAALAAKARDRYKDPAYRKKMGDAVRAGYQRPEARANLSAALLVVKAKPEVKARCAAATKLSTQNPARNAAISKANLGRKHSAEMKAKLSAAKKGKKLSPEHVERIAAGHRGLKRTEETKARMSAAITPAHKAASSERNKARYARMTPEEREAMREVHRAATKKWWDSKRSSQR